MNPKLSYEEWLKWTNADTMQQLIALMQEHGHDQHEQSQADLRAAYEEYLKS